MAWGDTYEQLTSIANIDESAQYVLGDAEKGFHYSGTSSWGMIAQPNVQTPLYYTLKKGSDGTTFTAVTTIEEQEYYLTVPTSKTFTMSLSETSIGMATGGGIKNATSTTVWLIRVNTNLRAYSSATGSVAYFYKVVSDGVATTTTAINVPADFNTDVHTSTTAGQLTATVSANGTAISGAVVSWESSNEGVATIDASGNVTLVAAGTTTITATYAGVEGQYEGSSATYTLTVTDSTPFEGGDVTFVGGTDLGSTTTTNADQMTKSVVTVSSTSAAFATAEYRLYANSTTSFSVLEGYYITRIEFTKNGSYKLSDLSANVGNYDSSAGIWTGNASSVDFSAAAQVRLDKIVVTVSSGTPKQNATVEISATELEVNGEVATATVTTDGPDVTLSTSDAAIASVSGTTVTAVGAGTATITATWEENDTFVGGTKEFTVTVTDPNAPGSINYPYTVAQARAAIEAGTGVTGVYATGTVSEIVTPYNSQYGNISYNISTDGLTTSDQLQAYRGKSYNGDNFTSEDDIQVGDVVVIYGNLTKFVNQTTEEVTYEFEANNKLVSLTRPEKPKHQVSFYVNGEVSSTIEVSEEEAITFPENPADIEGKTFVGWTANEIEGTQDEAPEMVTTATMGTADVAFYSVFATATEGGIVETTDVLNRATTGVSSGAGYSSWYGKTVNSSAIYAGQSAGGNDCIQLRSDNSNSGVITTKSGGKLKSMFVTWGSTTNNARVLSIYGSNTAYSAATDLYDSDTQGTLIGEIKCEDKGTDLNSAVLTITDDYAYIGIRSKSGALYLSSVSITWEGEGAASYSGYCTTIPTPEIITVTIKDAGYATFANEKAVDFSAQAGLTVMTAQYDADNDKIVYNEVTSKKVPAGVAVVLKGTADDYEGKVIASADALENNGLKVNLTENVDATGKEYCLAKLNGVVGFYKVATTTYVKAGKAYLEIERPDATSNAKDFYAIEDDTDGIGQIENGELTIENSVVYDLSGRKINEVSGRHGSLPLQLPKGIYIVNGKKVVVK